MNVARDWCVQIGTIVPLYSTHDLVMAIMQIVVCVVRFYFSALLQDFILGGAGCVCVAGGGIKPCQVGLRSSLTIFCCVCLSKGKWCYLLRFLRPH